MVVLTILKNMKVSWDDYSILFPIYGKIIQMFQTTKQFRLLTQPPQNIRCDLVASSSQRISAEDVSRCTLPCVHWDLAVTSNAWWMSNEKKIYIYIYIYHLNLPTNWITLSSCKHFKTAHFETLWPFPAVCEGKKTITGREPWGP